MKITATATITYDVDEVLEDLRHDNPDLDFNIADAKDMIHRWIKDDFGSMIIDPKIEETNG